VLLVLGNSGPEVIADHGYSECDPDGFAETMNAFNSELE
jgi:hypothetical protein